MPRGSIVDGLTPLMVAVRFRHPHLVDLLLRRGARATLRVRGAPRSVLAVAAVIMGGAPGADGGDDDDEDDPAIAATAMGVALSAGAPADIIDLLVAAGARRPTDEHLAKASFLRAVGFDGVDDSTRAAHAACDACARLPSVGQPTFKVCARCKSRRYCGVACQRAHWPTHKKECKNIARAET